jgi:hypothetical protein
MSGSLTAIITIPIVVAVVLFTWLAVVLRADTHPRYRHRGRVPRYEVSGGAFQANDGGRQLMPIPGGRPMIDRPGYAATGGVPAQRMVPEMGMAAKSEAGVPAQATADQRTAGEPQAAAERHLVAGSKIR